MPPLAVLALEEWQGWGAVEKLGELRSIPASPPLGWIG